MSAMKHTGVLLLKYAAKALLNSSSWGLVPSPVRKEADWQSLWASFSFARGTHRP